MGGSLIQSSLMFLQSILEKAQPKSCECCGPSATLTCHNTPAYLQLAQHAVPQRLHLMRLLCWQELGASLAWQAVPTHQSGARVWLSVLFSRFYSLSPRSKCNSAVGSRCQDELETRRRCRSRVLRLHLDQSTSTRSCHRCFVLRFTFAMTWKASFLPRIVVRGRGCS